MSVHRKLSQNTGIISIKDHLNTHLPHVLLLQIYLHLLDVYIYISVQCFNTVRKRNANSHEQMGLKNILHEERKIMKMIQSKDINDGKADMGKRRLKFYADIDRLIPNRLTNKTIKYIKTLKVATPWVKQFWDKAKIISTDVIDRNI